MIFNIVTFLWNDPRAKHTPNFTYGPDHVNKLFRQLKKGFDAVSKLDIDQGVEDPREFIFTVVTDHKKISDFDMSAVGATGSAASDGIKVVPLWDDFRDLGRCFTKLKMFSEDHQDLYGEDRDRSEVFKGDFLIVIDLDIVIINPEAFVKTLTLNTEQPFKGYRDTKNPRCYSGALWRIDTQYPGGFHNVYDLFRHMYDTSKVGNYTNALFSNWNKMSSFVGSDQNHITMALGEHTYPYKWNDREHGIWDFWQVEHLPSLPLNTVAVFMNGMRRDASMKEFQDRYPWIATNWRDV